jgi:hypothetical protein
MIDLDRRLLIIGHWGPDGAAPNHSRVQGVVGRLQKALGPGGRYPFRPMSSGEGQPDVLYNPSDGELTAKLSDEPAGVTDNTLLFLYYVGHSVGAEGNDLRLRLRYKTREGVPTHKNLSTLLIQVRDAGFKKIVLALDCCHAGRTIGLTNNFPISSFAMLGTGNGYAYNCDFTESVLSTLERSPSKRDQRIDRTRKGFTYERLFEGARAPFVSGSKVSLQVPQRHDGGLAFELLADAPVTVTVDYNPLVPRRTVYGRIYVGLELLRDNSILKFEFPNAIKSRQEFMIERGDGQNSRYLKPERALEYCEFLVRSGLAIEDASVLRLSGLGEQALASRFNEVLLKAISDHILPETVGYADLDEAVDSLIKDMIPPTPAMISERLLIQGKSISLDSSTRIALLALPSTGRFLKSAADALFPSDPELAA